MGRIVEFFLGFLWPLFIYLFIYLFFIFIFFFFLGLVMSYFFSGLRGLYDIWLCVCIFRVQFNLSFLEFMGLEVACSYDVR